MTPADPGPAPDDVRGAATPLVRLPRYAPSLPYGWVLGHFAVRDLIRFAPELVHDVRLHDRAPAAQAHELRTACADRAIPVRRDDATIEAKRSKGTARVLATFAKRWRPLDPARHHLVLVAPREPGNLGTLLRTSLARIVAAAVGIALHALAGPTP
ncbi:MAG: hypothetical protein WD336_09745 [Trueperaceae bacterium]